MGQVVRAPLYVPKPAEDTPWVGGPTRIAAVLIAALVPTFFIGPTEQIRPAEETYWQRPSQPMPLSLRLPAAAPFFNSRQFVFVDETPNFKSIPFYIPVTTQAVLPFFNVRRTEHVPEPGWSGGPLPTPNAIKLPPAIPQSFRNAPWQGPIPDPDWVKGGGSIPLAMLQLPALPAFTVKGTRHFDHVPEPYWSGAPSPVPIVYTVPPVVVLPFHNIPWQGPIPDPDWVKGGGAIPLVQLQLPAQPSFTVKGTHQFNFVAEPDWTGKPNPVSLNISLQQAALPFFNPRRFDYATDLPSQPSYPMPQVLQRLPAQPPFTVKGTRIFNVPDDVPWSMHGKGSAVLFLPPSISGAVQVLKNVVVRTRIVSNTTTRVRILKNVITRGNS